MQRPPLVELDQESLAYPPRFFALEAPPVRLSVAGSLASLGDRPVIGIVGSRAASTEGVDLARRWARALAEAGVLVVSGGALGIDAAAHRGALDAQAPTVCVLPGPLEAPGPTRNLRLFHEVLAGGGAWIHERDAGLGKVPFMLRNRLIAALADWVLVVEARAKSGTRHTVEAARKLGRPVAFAQWPQLDPRGEGQRAKWGRGAMSVDGTTALLEVLGLAPRSPPSDPLLALLDDGPQSGETLARALGRSVSEVLRDLSRLELIGVVDRRGGRYWRSR